MPLPLTLPPPPITHLKFVATLPGTLLKAILTNIAILFRKNALSAFLAALPLNVYLTSTLVLIR